MKALIMYDSAYGNTAKIAEAIYRSIHTQCEARLVKAADVDNQALEGIDLLIIGSPTQGGRPTQAVQECIKNLPPLQNVDTAAFDTRFAVKEQKVFLRFVMKTVGYAAEKIAAALERSGGNMVVKPEGYIVENEKGPLRMGEVERAALWAKQVYKKTHAPAVDL